MNKDALLRVAEAIDRGAVQSLRFDMTTLGRQEPSCGTATCIAGWQIALTKGIDGLLRLMRTHDDGTKIEKLAADGLGLNGIEADALFYTFCQDGAFRDKSLDQITPAQAVRTLRYAAEHGVIDWDKANEGYES